VREVPHRHWISLNRLPAPPPETLAGYSGTLAPVMHADLPEGNTAEDYVGEEPGWYRDPEDPDGQRYWDGEKWGERRKPKPPRERPSGKANRLAVTALILAGVGPLLVGGILATVFGYVALDEIEESEGKERGKAIAQWAIGLGFLNIAIWCAAIVFVLALLL
jgi:hypothetical protein